MALSEIVPVNAQEVLVDPHRSFRWIAVLVVSAMFLTAPVVVARPMNYCTGPGCAAAIVRIPTRFGSFVKPRPTDPIVTSVPGRDAVLNLESEVGRKLSIDHVYYHFDAAWPMRRQMWDKRSGRIPLINWSPDPTYTWVDVADGLADPVIDARAQAARAFGSKMMVSFSHEPENDIGMGTPADYVAAWQHVVSRFHEDGVTNIRFVLILMAETYNQGLAMQWFPGTDYVDVVGADGYNWYGAQIGAPWREVQDIFGPADLWAEAVGLPFIIAEAGCLEDPADPYRKANWFLAAASWLATQPNIRAFVYFNSDPLYPWWADSSAASLDAYRTLGESIS